MRRHLTYANVMSTLGVFLGLAGGYAIGQIGGDGSVRSGQAENLTPEPKTVVKVPKLGRVTARCESGEDTLVAWKHTSDRKQVVSVEFTDSAFGFVSNPGVVHEYALDPTTEPKVVFQVAPYNGNDTPQTVVSVFAEGPSGECVPNVAAEAVSTK